MDSKKSFLSFTNKRWLALLLIYICTFFAFSNTFRNEFVMDDAAFIVNWPLIQDWRNFGQFFVGYTPPPGQEGIYSPLKTFFHALNYHLFGNKDPFGHHVMALLIHFLGIWIVYKISFFLTEERAVAFLAGLFFALHPVHVEAITALTGSIDSLGVIFMLVAFYFYMKSTENDQSLNVKFYLGAMLFALAAIFTHELNVSLPLLFLYYDLCSARKVFPTRKIIFRVLPFFIFVGFYVFCKYEVLGAITRGIYVNDSFYLTMLISIKALAKYIYILFLPLTLTHNQMIAPGIYSFDQDDFDRYAVLSQSFFDLRVIVALFLIGGMIYLALRYLKREPLVSFCVGWFLISLLPGMNIIPSGVYFAERYLYPGSMAFCLLLAYFIFWISTKEKFLGKIKGAWVATLIIFILCSFYIVRTWIRNKDWRNEIVLYESAVKANPKSALMRTDLGLVYIRHGKLPEALESFKKALAIRPDDPVTYFAMAEGHLQLKAYDKAIKALKKAIELDLEYADAYYNLAGIYAAKGQMKDARENLESSMKYYRQQGRSDEADQLEAAFEQFFTVIVPNPMVLSPTQGSVNQNAQPRDK